MARLEVVPFPIGFPSRSVSLLQFFAFFPSSECMDQGTLTEPQVAVTPAPETQARLKP
jgi:hypothetical protein